MSDKNRGIKNLIEAHSWLGVIISVTLFIVFFAGSVILFIPEIQSWAEVPSHPVDQRAEDMPIQQVVESVLENYSLNREEHLTIQLANEQDPYHNFYIDLLPEPGYEGPEQVAELRVDPKTGEVVGSLEQFHLADFLYVLHYNLHLPGGIYLVGLVTLVFMVLIMTGIWIHARKIVSNFFLYRKDKKRNRLLDIHNLVGVMSLPYTFMYALTGLIFNLSIVFQLAFAVFLYQGSIDELMEDAGYTTIAQELSGETLAMDGAYDILARAAEKYGPLNGFRFYNYGDKNAVLQIYGNQKEYFAQHVEQYFRLADGSMITGLEAGNNNALRRGVDVVAALHFGDFAGVDLRILYFLLGLGVCGMIVAGNLLWIDKRVKQKNVKPAAISLVSNLTMGGCCGTIIGTAMLFLAERVLPLGIGELGVMRGDWLSRIFALTFLLTIVLAFFIRHKRLFMRISLYLSACLLALTILSDWLIYGGQMGQLWRSGYHSVIGVEVGMLLMLGLFLWIARALAPRLPEQSDVVQTFKMKTESL